MSKFSLSSLRSRAIILVLLAVLPLLVLTLYSYFDQRDRAVRQLQKNELVTARNLANVQEGLISATRDLLTILARLPQVQQHDREVCNLLFAKLMEQSPYYTALLAADREGQVFASAPASEEPVNVADRFFFQKAIETRSFSVGEPVLGRITQKYNINLAYPILDDAGQLQGVLTAGVDLSWLGSLLAKHDLPPSTALVLTNATGKVLYRYPEPLKYIGKMIPEFLVKAMTASDDGVMAGVGLPGDERLFAFARLSPPWQDMRVVIGLPEQVAVMQVNRDLWYHLIWLGLVALFAVVAAWSGGDLFVVRPVKKLRTITELLAAGDLSVRAGPDYTVGELGLLAHSFDQMADSLQDREAALRESNERLRLFIEHAPASLAMFDKKMRYLSVSRRWLMDYGLENRDILGLSHYEVFPEIPEGWKEIHRRGLAGEVIRAEGDRFERSDSSEQWLRWEVRPWHDDSGGVGGIVIFTEDITERKRAEAALRRAKEEWERTFDAVPDLIAILDVEHHIIQGNRALAQALGVSQQDLVGKFCYECMHGTEAPPAFCPHSRTILDGREHTEEVRSLDRDLLVTTAPILDARGKLLGSVHLARDITERKRAEETLQQRTVELEFANQELEAFTYSVSHDLKTPLRAIQGFSRMLAAERASGLDEEGLRLLKVIISNTQTMANLIDDLLALSRLGRQQLRKSVVNLAAISKHVFEQLRSHSPARDLRLIVGDLPPAWGDQSLLHQVMMNLLANAVKFSQSRETAVIEVGGRTEGKEDIYYVKDNGVGFDESYADKLFGVFQRLHGGEEYEGTGVGLAIVQRIIFRHGGRIWAEGKVGEGATFYFALPIK
jgi:PAS domain S-box-containing protein